MYRFHHLVAAFLAATALTCAQVVPDGVYYKFNEGAGTTTANLAFPGVGSPAGMIVGSLGWGTGQFGGGLTGTGQSSSSNYVDTGWAMNLNGLSWTIEFWWATPPSGSTQYVCGSNSSTSSFRIFSSSTPGNNFVLSGTGITTSIIGTIVPPIGTFVHIAYVFDAAAVPPTIYGYANGALLVTTPQSGTPVLNAGNFVVGAAQTQGGLNGTLDEFRLWLTARTATEIAATYNMELFNENLLAATTTGIGDLNLSLTLINPSATEGYTLLSAATGAAVGTGPVFGIWPDALTWQIFFIPIGAGNPLHFITGISGLYPGAPFIAPPGSLLGFAGTTLDFSVLLLGPGFSYVGRSNVVRVSM